MAPMTEIIAIESVPAKLTVNFEAMQKALAEEMKRYDVVVTADTVADAKKLATELNKTKKIIDDRRKAEAAEASAPVKAFDEQMKELVTLCETGRQKLLDQVKRFEDETRNTAQSLLAIRRAEQWELQGVREEFMRAEFDDLVLISNITGKGQLTKQAKDTLDARVAADRAAQDRTDGRIALLEAESFKAGLAAPLTRDHVKAFLTADDQTYFRELCRIIAVELDRQEQAAKAIREKAEREVRAKIEAEQRAKRENEEAEQRAKLEAERQRIREEERAKAQQEAAEREEQRQSAISQRGKAAEATHGEPAAEASPQAPVASTSPTTAWRRDWAPDPAGDKIAYTVTAVFKTSVSASVPASAIQSELRRVMERAGITTLKSVLVVPQSEPRTGQKTLAN